MRGKIGSASGDHHPQADAVNRSGISGNSGGRGRRACRGLLRGCRQRWRGSRRRRLGLPGFALRGWRRPGKLHHANAPFLLWRRLLQWDGWARAFFTCPGPAGEKDGSRQRQHLQAHGARQARRRDAVNVRQAVHPRSSPLRAPRPPNWSLRPDRFLPGRPGA